MFFCRWYQYVAGTLENEEGGGLLVALVFDFDGAGLSVFEGGLVVSKNGPDVTWEAQSSVGAVSSG